MPCKLHWLLAIAFFSLLFTEIRTINYQFFGPRSASFSDVLFFVSTIVLLVIIIRNNGFSQLLRQVLSLWYLLGPIVLMLFFYTDKLSINPSLNRYQLYGCSMYMLFSALVLAQYANEKILTYLSGYMAFTVAFFLFIYLYMSVSQPHSGLHFPFSSQNQTALFGVLSLILGMGVALAAKRFYFLYLVIPVMVLVILQTGSRTGALLLVFSWALFASLILVKWVYQKNCQRRELTHLLCSAALAAIILFLYHSPQSIRAISIFDYSAPDIITGSVDNYRNQIWSKTVSDLLRTGELSDSTKFLILTNFNGGMHNAYLDLWLNWGWKSLLSFLAFVVVLLASVVRLTWVHRTTEYYPLYVALLVGCGAILTAIYANPLLHLKFVWVFFGLVFSRFIAISLIQRQINPNSNQLIGA